MTRGPRQQEERERKTSGRVIGVGRNSVNDWILRKCQLQQSLVAELLTCFDANG